MLWRRASVALRWFVFLLVPGAGLFGQTPAPEAQHLRTIAHPPVAGGGLSGIAWDGQAWVAVGTRSTILRSVDGQEWQPQAVNAEVCFRKVMSAQGTRLALTYCRTVLISQDGLCWEPRRSPGLLVRCVTFGRGMFVGVGNSGTILVSSNAAVWTATAPRSAESLLGVHYAEEQFVAVGTRGTILGSTDGQRWTRRDSPTTRRLRGLTQGDGIWVAVGSHGAILRSPDGTQWTSCESGTEESLQAVAFGDGTFLAVGRNGCVLASGNAREWRALPSVEANLCDVAYARGRFVAVGDRDTILLVSGLGRVESDPGREGEEQRKSVTSPGPSHKRIL